MMDPELLSLKAQLGFMELELQQSKQRAIERDQVIHDLVTRVERLERALSHVNEQLQQAMKPEEDEAEGV